MRRWLATAAATAVLSLSPAAGAQFDWGVRTPKQAQANYAAALAPVVVVPAPSQPPRPSVVPLRLRVYASRDYRSQTTNWEARFRRLLERVNGVVQSWPGVRFEVEAVRAWEASSSGSTLTALLEELARLDAGEEVDFVVGLAPSEPMFPTSIHDLGMARVAGRHMVLRNQNDVAEYRAIASSLDLLSQKDRERLVEGRKAHKDLVVFLHEWAHTLGGIHTTDRVYLMNAQYNNLQERFDAGNVRIINLYLRHRDGAATHPRWREEWREELRRYVETSTWTDFDREDRKALLGLLSGRAPAPKATAASSPAVAPVSTVAATDQAVLEQTFALYQKREYAQAWSILSPIYERHLEEPRNAVLACDLMARQAVGTTGLATIERVCRRAEKLLPDDPWPLVMLARAYLTARDEERAHSAIARAHQRAEYRKPQRPDDWSAVANLYVEEVSPTLAEEAATHAGGQTATEVADWARLARRLYAIPAGHERLAAEDEAAYVRAQVRAKTLVDARDLDGAAALLDEYQRKFAELPGPYVLRCQLRLLQRRLEEGQKACNKALQLQEDSLLAHHFAANAFLSKRNGKEAISHFWRVVELDSRQDQAWKMLAQLLRASHQSSELERLRAAHLKAVGKPFPEN